MIHSSHDNLMLRFEYPSFLLLLWILPILLLFWVVFRQWRRRAVERLGDPALMERLLPHQSPGEFWVRRGLVLTAIALLIVAAANPQRGAKQQQVKQESADVFIALDISQSMYCADVAPSRLERARIFAQQLVKALEGERIGLIFFAGDAFLQMPLSTDYEAAEMFLRAAAPDMVSAQGTALAATIDLARESFDPNSKAGRALILITDGEDHDAEAAQRAAAAYEDGVVVFAVGAGTTQGGPIPIGGRQYKRDEAGGLVRTRLNESLLRAIAAEGHGSAYNVSQGRTAINALDTEVDQMEKRARTLRSYADFESHFQWLLAPAIFLLLLAQLPFRNQS